MTSLKRNEQLNPALWDGERLKEDVRVHLLNFGEAWRRYANIPESAVVDVWMVGGNAGYYYNEASDIDVHLIVDRASLGFGSVTEDYLRDRKALWTIKHDVRVKGYQVEPYAQDVGDKPVGGQGVYSLKRGEWIQRPTLTDYDPAVDNLLAKRVDTWRGAIDKLLSSDSDVDEFDALKNKLGDMRSRAISRGGEFARDNLVFKSLRLSGHLDRMTNFVNQKKTKALTLEGKS